MKKLFLLTLLISEGVFSFGQMYLGSNSRLVVAPSATLTVNDLTSDGGLIVNDGQLFIHGKIINQSGSLTDASGSGTIIFNGNTTQQISGAAPATMNGNVILNNAAGLSLTDLETGSPLLVNGSLELQQGNFILNNFDLKLGNSTLSGCGSDRYIKTNGSGKLSRTVSADGSTEIVFPIGNTAYNPLSLINAASATTDDYTVGLSDSKPASFSGTDHLVNRTWSLSEEVAGGSDLTLKFQWNTAEEISGFDRSEAACGFTTDNGSTVSWSNLAAASGAGPYQLQRQSVTSMGTFFVADIFYAGKRLDVKVFLAGPYNGATGTMRTTLRTANLVSTIDPYGLNTVASNIPADVVDWVEVSLRDADFPDNATAATNLSGWPKAMFLRSDGKITDLNGDLPNVGSPVYTNNLYVVVKHRNHINVLSNNPLAIGENVTYDFSTAVSQAFGGANGYKQIASGVYGMVQGDLDANGSISTSDFNLWAISFGQNNVYNNRDADLDGNISTSDFNAWAVNFGASNPLSKGFTGYKSIVP